MKQTLAIVGSGVSGIAAAYFLQNDYAVTLIEKGSYLGGHTNTVEVEEDGKKIPIDTGFIVFNHVTYPNLLRFFEKLSVPTKKSDMSFSVQYDPMNLEFCGSGLGGLFAQKKNLFSIRYIKMLLEINRFNETAPAILEDPKYNDWNLDRYIKEFKFGQDILNFYLIPMSSAVWSTPPSLMLDFPAKSLIRFFYNHGFLGLNTQHQWWTVDGGSWQYVQRFKKSFQGETRINSQVKQVKRANANATIVFQDGSNQTFDKVILATHGYQSFGLLETPTELETILLPRYAYQPNTATLHTDDSDMPKKKKCWSSWNYKISQVNGNLEPYTLYWMNRLQGVSQKQNYFVTINDPGRVDPKKIIQKVSYEHPLFSVPASLGQEELPKLNEAGPIYYCGAYFRYGFHEDGFLSGLNVAKAILKRDPWN